MTNSCKKFIETLKKNKWFIIYFFMFWNSV
jgi:hypothetical protein